MLDLSLLIIAGEQGGDIAADLPGQVPARQRDAGGPGAARRQDHRDAPRAPGVAAGTLQSRRSPSEEDGTISVLRRPDLHHPLGASSLVFSRVPQF